MARCAKDFVALDNKWKRNQGRFTTSALAIYFRKLNIDTALYLLCIHPQLYFTTTTLLKKRMTLLPNPSDSKWACLTLRHSKEIWAQLLKPCNRVESIPLGGTSYYNPPYFSPGPSPGPVTIRLPDKPPVLKDQPPIIFPSATPPNLMSKQPLPMNPPLVEDLPPHVDMPCPMSIEPLPEPLALEPPVKPLIPIPWNIHHRQYLSMEEFVEHVMQNLVSQPVDDLDSPMSDAPPLEPDPVTPYLPDSPEGHTHTLSPDKSPTEPQQQ